ncbi:phosphonatase-like hydrolase [Cellulomonas sp. GbtcB1]|uniref:phosphonatase-like hydrolase n=1 Tax=Cellulomonas sp. GbtcB1 TaxID=2824746 RepID=UPI001C30F7BF|nr:phosphonatase-like hydrolase [Cellulomonas sp. GbtcB1]
MTRTFDLVALDMAGTTVEEHGAVYEALHRAAAEHGSAATAADIETWMGAEKRAALDALLRLGETGPRPAPDAATVDAAFARFGVLLADAYATRPPTAIPGVPEAFATLRRHGVKVALTTGFTRDVATSILDVLGWTVAASPEQQLSEAVTLDALTCADEVPLGRPAPHMVHRCMERTGVVDVARVLVAGDTVRDLQSGRNAGAGAVVGVLTGKLGAAGLGRERHDYLLDSVADLPGLLDLA